MNRNRLRQSEDIEGGRTIGSSLCDIAISDIGNRNWQGHKPCYMERPWALAICNCDKSHRNITSENITKSASNGMGHERYAIAINRIKATPWSMAYTHVYVQPDELDPTTF